MNNLMKTIRTAIKEDNYENKKKRMVRKLVT